YVLSRFQGAGLGRALVERAKAAAIRRGGRRLLLGVYTGNQRAIDFYRRLGFQTVGARRFRVGDSDNDDLIMALALPAA
ncbi:MAG: GNAT family N-acetyltransferase, partial [Pirellulales bacterium]|nr:GNAT family N-acetyltransferase [Pirellulales bacterium]